MRKAPSYSTAACLRNAGSHSTESYCTNAHILRLPFELYYQSLADVVININAHTKKSLRFSLSLSFAVNIVPRSCTFQAPEASAAHDPKTMTQRLEFINYAGGADLLLETCCDVLTGAGR